MAYEKKHGDITLSPRNKTNDRQPDLSGSILLDGKEYDVALWLKNGKNGNFYSGRMGKEVEKKPQGQFQQRSSFPEKTFSKHDAPAINPFDDEIPFK